MTNNPIIRVQEDYYYKIALKMKHMIQKRNDLNKMRIKTIKCCNKSQ